MAYISVEDIGKEFPNGVCALEDLSFTTERGEFVSIVGPSGCGKSTLLRIVAGLRTPTSGTVSVNGELVRGPHEVGMVFQTAALLPWRTALQNILLAPELAGRSGRGRRWSKKDPLPGYSGVDYESRARDLLELVGLADFADHLPDQLSGGMQQRVALCRALVNDPDLLLMDEPFGALDALTRDEMNIELLRIYRDASLDEAKTVLFVTHSIDEAVFLSDKILIMSPRPGRFIAEVPSALDRPRGLHTQATEEFRKQSTEIFELLHAPSTTA